MKKIAFLFLILMVVSCGSKAIKTFEAPPLYEVLTQQSTGGANIRFYEILTEPREIKMLQNDVFLRKKISSEDVRKSNFVILNMGEQATGGYSIGVENVVQKNDSIVVQVKEFIPKPTDMLTQGITYPYCVLKINSKKPIRFK
ncbi:protease complex subunit PrcB family protein [Flavobacterium faecale]|uniref:protease complex subunit PrcB family protein n=1 Tax=Flavobacterium faecale TaxID=1355330 RepID=UPI003AAB2706